MKILLLGLIFLSCYTSGSAPITIIEKRITTTLVDNVVILSLSESRISARLNLGYSNLKGSVGVYLALSQGFDISSDLNKKS